MLEKIRELICVDGNHYFTPYGIYVCKVTATELQGGIINIKVSLESESDASQPARCYTLTCTRRTLEIGRLWFVTNIHQWALLNRDDGAYWVKKVHI